MTHPCPDCARPLAYFAGERCVDCHNAAVAAWRAARRRELAAEPRCEAGCKRRGTYRVAGAVLLCGAHVKRLERAYARRMADAGPLALVAALSFRQDADRETLLKMARGGDGPRTPTR